MAYIGAHGVAALHRYKYSGVDHSYVSKYILNPFWIRFVKIFPLWMPPNMITLTGFMFLMISALLGYIYSPRLDSAPPRWVHFMHGLLLFLYQFESSTPVCVYLLTRMSPFRMWIMDVLFATHTNHENTIRKFMMALQKQ